VSNDTNMTAEKMAQPAWLVADVIGIRDETSTARTLILSVPDWPGHRAGQHIDVRLTAEDGYQATRSYSLASAPSLTGSGAAEIEISVELLDDGEVSPYLVRVTAVGDQIEILGPIGGYFVWTEAQKEPVQLIAGGSGIAPLRAILHERAAAETGPADSLRLLYSARARHQVYYEEEIADLSDGEQAEITLQFTRSGPQDWSGTVGRIDTALLERVCVPAALEPTVYICGPTSFVELVASALVGLGHDQSRIRTERFGG
jgi:ferredoxin-NADP reductase